MSPPWPPGWSSGVETQEPRRVLAAQPAEMIVAELVAPGKHDVGRLREPAPAVRIVRRVHQHPFADDLRNALGDGWSLVELDAAVDASVLGVLQGSALDLRQAGGEVVGLVLQAVEPAADPPSRALGEPDAQVRVTIEEAAQEHVGEQ